MISVRLIDVRMDASHGIYDGEENVGNPYIVNLDVKYDERDRDVKKLAGTVDYVHLHRIVQESMTVPTALLERLCEKIVKNVHDAYPFAKEIVLSIQKLQPPIKNFNGRVGVTMHKYFDE